MTDWQQFAKYSLIWMQIYYWICTGGVSLALLRKINAKENDLQWRQLKRKYLDD